MQSPKFSINIKYYHFLIYPLILFIFWICSFSVFRAFFFYFNTKQGYESLEGFFRGFLLDISTASYLLIPSLSLWTLSMFIYNIKHLKEFALFINIILFALISIIEISSLALYKEWGTTFNARAYEYVFNFSELSHVVTDNISIPLIIVLVFSLVIGIFSLFYINSFYEKTNINIKSKLTLILILSSLCFIGLRGGLGKLPISPSSAFYSKNITNNYMAVNKAYYFMYSMTKTHRPKVSKNSYSQKDLINLYDRIYTKKDTIKNTHLKVSKPNIIFIILEGIPADVVKPLNGLVDVTPNLNNLSQEGIFFSNIYSSGMRTDQGLLSILSGLPALSSINVMSNIELANKLPSMLKTLKELKYYTSFFYGGSLDFSNINNYILSNKTDLTISKSSFDINQQNISWGVPDDILFEKAKIEIGNIPKPFFSTILTQSSHPPFDLKTRHKFQGDDTPSKFKSSVYFTDSCLGSFLEQCKQQDWYDSTLFVIVSDHGSLYLENRHYNHHRRFQIPLIIYGPALKEGHKGQVIERLGNHHDIPKTILSLLGLKDSLFLLSKDLFLERDLDHAYWAGEQTIGWINNKQKIVVDHLTREVYFQEKTGVENTDIENALKYQNIISEYIY